jgi:Arc/MetJ-type ribon-helix-helix transcriptional regulator
MKQTEIVNIRLPEKHIEWLDTLVKKGIYKTRSEAVREFGREYITNKQKET